MKAYLLAFNDFMGTQQSVLAFLDTRKEILHWCSILPHSIIIVSELTAFQLADIFRNQFPGRHFLISEIQGVSSDGWLPAWVWDFVNQPKSSGRWK